MLHQRPFLQDSSNFTYIIQRIERALQNMDICYRTEFVDKDNQDKMQLPYKLLKERFLEGLLKA